MAYATRVDLLTRVPATAAVPSALQQIALDDAEEMISDELFGSRTLRAHCMLAAHYLAVMPGSGMTTGEGGLVTAKSAGEISASYAVSIPTGWDPLLATTVYGRMFLQILSTLVSYPESDDV